MDFADNCPEAFAQCATLHDDIKTNWYIETDSEEQRRFVLLQIEVVILQPCGITPDCCRRFKLPEDKTKIKKTKKKHNKPPPPHPHLICSLTVNIQGVMSSKWTRKLCLRGTRVTAKLSGSEGTLGEGREEKWSAGLKIEGADGDNEKQQNRMEARLQGAFPADDDTT